MAQVLVEYYSYDAVGLMIWDGLYRIVVPYQNHPSP